MNTQHSKPWFAAKRYGYGSGWPIAWQGWLIVAVYVAVVTSASLALSPLLAVGTLIASTAVLMIVCAKRTGGGWRWRNGGE